MDNGIEIEKVERENILAQPKHKKIKQNPKKIIIKNNFVLSKAMIGNGASVITSYAKNRIIEDDEIIKDLIDAGAEIYILEQ